VEVGPVLAVNKVSRAAAEKKRERCFMVLIEWAVGEAIRRRLAHLYSATRHIKLKMVKNATKRSKSAVNRPPGLFLNRKSGGGDREVRSRFAAAVHGRAADRCSGLPPPASAQAASYFPDFRPSDRTSWLGCLSGPRCCRRGRVKFFIGGRIFI
jgi:hypothetical protein